MWQYKCVVIKLRWEKVQKIWQIQMTNIHSTKFLYAYYWRVARMYSQPIPDKYYKLTEQEVDERIYKAKEELVNRLVILGHHYQRDEVIRFADYRGDLS